MKLSIIKYLVLFSVLGCAVYVFLTKNTFTSTLLYVVIGLTILYAVFAVLDNLNKPKKASSDHKYVYYTPGLLTKKIIVSGAYAIAAIALFLTGTKIILFGFILCGMMLSELINLFISIRNDNYFIYFQDKAILFEQDQLIKVFSSHIKEIEYRYDILYLTLTNNQVRLIETEKIEKSKRESFIKEFISWAEKYTVPFTSEAREKLRI